MTDNEQSMQDIERIEAQIAQVQETFRKIPNPSVVDIGIRDDILSMLLAQRDQIHESIAKKMQ